MASVKQSDSVKKLTGGGNNELSNTGRMSEEKQISTIVNATNILKCLANNIGKITDIARRLDLNKATVHRTLKTLESTGFVSKDPVDRQYYLGPLVQELASDPLNSYQLLYNKSHKHLEYLRDISQETIGLQVRAGERRLVVDEVVSPQDIKFSGGRGYSGPIYVGASGKVILSELKENDLRALLNNLELVRLGPNTTTDKASLLNELDKIREQGYAISYNETGKGAAVIAVPIHHFRVPVALGIVGPGERFLNKRMDFLEPLLERAKKISESLSDSEPYKIEVGSS